MAGFWNQSQSQLYDENGKPMVGARAFFYAAATTTPIDVYGAYSLGLVNKLPNPLNTDGFGRWPSVYFDEADGFYRVRVTTADGVVVYDVDSIPIIGPAGGGGGGVTPIDPDSVANTGDLKWRYGEGLSAGWVRMNGRTIGSATSGASERANSDAQPLFEHLWNADPNLVVVGGRGGSSAADWAANKQITLPDARGRSPIGLDTMGNSAANVVAAATVLGWKGGAEKHTLVTTEIPAHSHTGTTGVAGAHDHTNTFGPSPSAGGGAGSGVFTNGGVSTTGVSGSHSHAFTTDNAGGGGAHNNLQPSMAITWYIRL